MQYKHIVKRGNRYYFVCRVPQELIHHFPSPVIWKSLKTDNKKNAHTLGSAIEFRTQKLFMQLRTGMLDPNLEKMILAEYLNCGLLTLETEVGLNIHQDSDDKEYLSELREMGQEGIDKQERHKIISCFIEIYKEGIKNELIPQLREAHYSEIIRTCQDAYAFKLSKQEAEVFKLKLMAADLQINKAAKQLYEGDPQEFGSLMEKTKRDLSSPYISLTNIIPLYLDHYKVSKTNLAGETFDKVDVECRVLLEIFGNISIDAADTNEKLTELKRLLKKYPKNKQQKYGAKSVHALLREGYRGEAISPKTANNYIKRMACIIDFAIARGYIVRANIYRLEGTLFDLQVIPELERPAYDKGDLERLIDAICTQALWSYGEPKPERFWIILIAIFHGFRLGNITSLTKSDICQIDSGTWVFQLKHGKSKSTVRPVAITDDLILLGFLDWVNNLRREKLFQDSSATFSKWYNRRDGNSSGFEARYVTSDPKKCLYSVRHSYAGEVYSLTEDLKATSDMMGHSLGHNVTNRYVKYMKVERQQVFINSLHQGIDLNKLSTRVEELFNL